MEDGMDQASNKINLSLMVFVKSLKYRWDSESLAESRFQLLGELCRLCDAENDFRYALKKAQLPILESQITSTPGYYVQDDVKAEIILHGGLITKNEDLIMIDFTATSM